MTDLEKFVIPNLNDKNAYRYLYLNKEFIPGKSTIYYSGPYWDENEINAIFKTVCFGQWLSAGENVHKFEVAFSKKFGFKSSLMVNSGSSANLVMIAALKDYYGWKDGDGVLVSVVGFPTTVNAIIQNGLKPIFVDISLTDLNWDVLQIEDKIYDNKVVALFSSPVLGNPYNLDVVLDICHLFDIKLISDNCDSLGSRWNGEYLTEHSVASSCSFYASHHICTSEGGMVSSQIEDIVKIARKYATWGRSCHCVGSANLLENGTCGNRFDKWLAPYYNEIIDHKYIFDVIGYNLKPLDIQGAIGIEQLKKFDEIKENRRRNKTLIQNMFEKHIKGVFIPREKENAETSWFGVPVMCESKELKEQLVSYLEKNKIQTRHYFSGNILLHPAYRDLDDYSKYPESIKVLDRVFFIGCAPHYTSEMLDYIEQTLSRFQGQKQTVFNIIV